MLTLPLVLALLAGCAAPEIGDDDVGTAVFVGDDLIRGYRPESTLVVPANEKVVARHPAIDVHCHWPIDVDPDALLAAMDERNVRAAVNLSGGFGAELEAMLARFSARAPDRLLIFANVDFSRIDEPDFGTRAAADLRRAHARGVRGLKIFKSLGLTVRDGSGALVPVDDPRLDPIWAVCGELGLPVLIHTADPVAFFAPIDECNERWMQLHRHPDWSFHGEAFPSYEEVLAQRDRMMARHRKTTFIGAHVGSRADDLAAASAMLDAHPNLVVDISGRVAALGRQPYSARVFLERYADRVLFGTDRYPGRADQPRYRIYFRYLETMDEYFEYFDHPFPPTGEWRIYGVGLPDAALDRIYHDNAARLLGLSPLARAAGS